MIRFITLVASFALAVTTAVFAAKITANWTNATENTDQTAIPASGPGSIASTTVEWSLCGPSDTFVTPIGKVTVPGSTNSAATPDNLGPGRYCARAYHTNTYGVNSAPTTVRVKVIEAPTPNPPSNFSLG